MGYYVSIVESNLVVPETDEVLSALQALSKRTDLMRGGSSAGDKWFSWMNNCTYTSVEEIFSELGFGLRRVREGLALRSYDSKTGQEELFIEAVAPFVSDGYIEWQGESGTHWRDVVEDGVYSQISPTITWK